MRIRKPRKGAKVLICDEDGDISVETVEPLDDETSWEEAYEIGNFVPIVAWMPLPRVPKKFMADFWKE